MSSASASSIEPEVGKKYRYSAIGGRVYDPDRYEEDGVFVHKFTAPSTVPERTIDWYIFARTLPVWGGRPQQYLLTYVFKGDIRAERGNMNAGFPIDDLVSAVRSADFVHPSYYGRLNPTKYIDVNEIETLTGRAKARQNISSFMTHVIYHPPIKKVNETGAEKTIFSGGPMYKRGMGSFASSSTSGASAGRSGAGAGGEETASKTTGSKRKSRKQRGGDGMGQPLKYTDASYQEPSAFEGVNLQGVEPPYLIRPRLDAIPMRGGADQILSPMSFQDAYHSPPHAPTGQPLTDLKLPATLRQGLNFGRLNGGSRRINRKNTRRGGFYPSVMGGVVSNAPLLAPLAARQGMLLLEQFRKQPTRRNRSRRTRKTSHRRNSGRRA